MLKNGAFYKFGQQRWFMCSKILKKKSHKPSLANCYHTQLKSTTTSFKFHSSQIQLKNKLDMLVQHITSSSVLIISSNTLPTLMETGSQSAMTIIFTDTPLPIYKKEKKYLLYYTKIDLGQTLFTMWQYHC